MPQVITLGEALIDFISRREGTLVDSPGFEKAMGGAPANVAVGLARLGVTSGYIGKVGDDPFGHFIANTLKENNVDIKPLNLSSEYKTGLAFVSLDSRGNRDFLFYREKCADMNLEEGDIDRDFISQARAFHFGTIPLSQEPVRSATKFALNTAKESGLWISFDPNIRLNLWEDESQVQIEAMNILPLCNIIKLSIEELEFLFPNLSIEDATDKIIGMGPDLAVITLGADGCFFNNGSQKDYVDGFKVKAIDTTGAGDAFIAGMLKGLLDRGSLKLKRKGLHEIMTYANAVAAITTTSKGAVSGFPKLKEVYDFLSNLHNDIDKAV